MSLAAPDMYDDLLTVLRARPQTRPTLRTQGMSAATARYAEAVEADGSTQAVYATRLDWLLAQIDLARAFRELLTAADVVISAVPYEMTFLGAQVERAVELTGACVIGAGGGGTVCPAARIVDLIWRYEPTVLIASAQLAAELAQLSAESGRDVASSSVRTIVIAGEACSRERLQSLAAVWAAEPRMIYGTDAIPTIATPCEFGVLHVGERLWPTVQPVDSMRASGTDSSIRGELQVAQLHSPVTQPQATGDVVELSFAPCPCQDTRPGVTPLGRIIDAVDTGQELIPLGDIERIVFSYKELRGPWSCVSAANVVEASCVGAPGLSAQERHQVQSAVEQVVRAQLGVDLRLDVLDGPTGHTPPPGTEGTP